MWRFSALIILIIVFFSCRKDSATNCSTPLPEVVVDPNFVLFPKTGGLWVYQIIYDTNLDTVTMVDSFRVGLPDYKSVKTIPFGDYEPDNESAATTATNKLFYPIIRKSSKVKNNGTIISSLIDTSMWIREDLAENAIYRTRSYSGNYPGLYELVHMDYDLQPGEGTFSFNYYFVGTNGGEHNLMYYYVNSSDSIYFNKRYLKRYFTTYSYRTIIQGFDIVFGPYETIKLYYPPKKAFYYKNDSIVQNYYY